MGSNISIQNASIQLFQCAQKKLGNLMLANDPRLIAKSESYIAKLKESVAVIKVVIGVKRAELIACIRTMMSVQNVCHPCTQKAETCNFTTVSECGKMNVTSYTEEAIKGVMLAGVRENDIRREVISTKDILSRPSFDII